MDSKITILSDSIGSVEATLLENENPQTVKAIWDNLPFESQASTWGDEIYFHIPVNLENEDPQATVETGDLAYWPPGQAFCLFFGSTPMSRGSEIRPASPVTVFGKIEGDPKIFKKVKSGDSIRIERA